MSHLPKKEILELVLNEAVGSTSFLTLYPGFQYFQKEIRGHRGLIAYIPSTTAWVGASDPVCSDPSILEELIFAFFAEAEKHGKTAMILPVAKNTAEIVRNKKLLAIQVGCDPWFNLRVASAKLPSVKQLLAKGAIVQSFDPAKIESREYVEIEEVAKSWLESKNMLPLGFLNQMAPWVHLQYKKYFRVIYNGHQIGYLVAVPTRKNKAWYLVDIVRLPNAPAGTTELLIMEAMKELYAIGAEEVSLGLCPLYLPDEEEKKNLPRAYKIIDFCFNKMDSFYSFKSLFQYKEKFNPTEWQPMYLVASKPSLSLLALFSLFRVMLPHSLPKILWSSLMGFFAKFHFKKIFSKSLTNQIVLRGMPQSLLEFLFRIKVTLTLIIINILFFSVANKNGGNLNIQFIESYAYQWNHFIANGVSLKSLQMLVIPSLLHWNLGHLSTNIAFLVLFVTTLELLAGSAIVSVGYFFGVILSNPLTTIAMAPILYLFSPQAMMDFTQILDVGSSLGIFACIGILGYLVKYSKTFIALVSTGVLIVAYFQQDLLSLNHLTAIVIGLALARYFIPKEYA